ncbi:MAG: polyprenol monophosphomannose synthase [Candidatus Hodarchaeota archaeon]
MQIVLVIPTYNERENIPRLIPKIYKVFRKTKTTGHVLIVDDNSPDGTWKIVKALQKEFDTLHLLRRSAKKGLGSAYRAGFAYVLETLNTDVIFEMDADLSHDPRRIPFFLQMITRGYDVVVGSRYIKGGATVNWPLMRRIISFGANMIANVLLRLHMHDVTSGFRCYRRWVLEKIDMGNITSEGYAFQEEMLFRAKKVQARLGEIPIKFVDRRAGKSKLSKKEILHFFLKIVQLFLLS